MNDCNSIVEAPAGGMPRANLRQAWLGLKGLLSRRSTAFWLSVAVTLSYGVTNLSFSHGLDDTVLEWTVRPPHESIGIKRVLTRLRHTFAPPDGLYNGRPLRSAVTYLLGRTTLLSTAIPDLLSALMTGLCVYVLIWYLRTAGLPEPTANWAGLWFFGCVPVVAMGQVTYASQFVLIAAMYGALALFEKFAATRRLCWLWASTATFFVAGLYGEAMLIPAAAIGCLAIVRLFQRRVRDAGEALAFCLLAAALVLGGGAMLSGNPAQISTGILTLLTSRATGIDVGPQSGLVQTLWRPVASFCGAFRPALIGSILLSLSPLLCLLVLGAFVANGFAKRKYFRPLLVVCLIAFAFCSIPEWLAVNTNYPEGTIRAAAFAGALVLLCWTLARRYPLLGCMAVAGTVLLGPAFVIDTHTTYILPAMAGVMFSILAEFLNRLAARGSRVLPWGIAGLLAVVGVSNFAGGAYQCASVVNDNERLAQEIGDTIRDDVILTNFRHAFDLFTFANRGRVGDQCRGDLWFSATVPYWPEERAVRDEVQLQHWFARARDQHKKAYFLVVDHDRLANKSRFHGPRFIDGDHRLKLVTTHTFSATAFCFDPIYLLSDYFQRHGLVSGFLSYPIFPDMIDDVGLEYSPFKKRVFACYRLLEVDAATAGGREPDFNHPPAVVEENMLGYRITTENRFFVAMPRPDSLATARHGRIASIRLDYVLHEIRKRNIERGAEFPAVEIADDDGLGTRIIVCDGRCFGLISEPAAFSLQWLLAGKYARVVEGPSVAAVKRRLDGHDEPPVELVLDGFHGFNIVVCEQKYFGVPQSSGAFSPNKAFAHHYAVCFEGTSLEQVKGKIENSLEPAVTRKPNHVQSTQ